MVDTRTKEKPTDCETLKTRVDAIYAMQVYDEERIGRIYVLAVVALALAAAIALAALAVWILPALTRR